MKAHKDQVQWINSSEHQELTSYFCEICETKQWWPSYERTHSSDILNNMKLERILESNIIKDITDAIKQSIRSFATTERSIVPEKLQIRERSLKVEINDNSVEESNETLQIQCTKTNYIECYYNLCQTHIKEKIMYLHFSQSIINLNIHNMITFSECVDQYCLQHYDEKYKSERNEWTTAEWKTWKLKYSKSLINMRSVNSWEFINEAFRIKQKECKNMLAHQTVTWSFCYNDNCQMHFSSKENHNYFPKKRKQQGNARTHV